VFSDDKATPITKKAWRNEDNVYVFPKINISDIEEKYATWTEEINQVIVKHQDCLQ